MKEIRKDVLSLLAILAVLVFMLAGCSASNDGTTSDGASSSSSSSSSSDSSSADTEPADTEPADAEPADAGSTEVITIALPQNANVEDYDTNYLTTLIEEEFGVDLQFEFLPADNNDAKARFALTVQTGGELADIVIFEQFTPLEIADYGSNGIFIPLNDYIENATYFNQIESESDKARMIQFTTSPDGNIYSLSKTYLEPWNETPNRMWINQVWLDNLGLDMPTTLDEYYEVAKAFATEDPNGNGTADEIAITGTVNGWGTNPVYYFMNSFIFVDDSGLQLAEDGKTVIAPFVTGEWYQGLEYLHKLTEEGLMDPAIFTQDGSQFTAVLGNEPQIVGSAAAGGTGYWPGSVENVNFQEMQMIAPLEGPEGLSYAAYTRAEPHPIFFITKDASNPDLAFAIGDFFFSKDVSIIGRYGEKGVDWTDDPAIVSEYTGMYEEKLGIPAAIARLNDPWSTVQNKHWYNNNPGYVSYETITSFDNGQAPGSTDFNYNAATRSDSYDFYFSNHPEVTLPTLAYTEAEADELAEIIENISSYVNTATAEFITGNRPLSDWDNYVAELYDNLQLQTYIDYSQTAYDRMVK